MKKPRGASLLFTFFYLGINSQTVCINTSAVDFKSKGRNLIYCRLKGDAFNFRWNGEVWALCLELLTENTIS